MTTAKDLDPDESFVAKEAWGRAMGQAMATHIDWQLHCMGPEVAAAREEWYEKLVALQEEYRQGVKAAFVPPPLPPGPYHLFAANASGEGDDEGKESMDAYRGSHTTIEEAQAAYAQLNDEGVWYGVRVGQIVVQADGRLAILLSYDQGEWRSDTLMLRLAHADALALADLQEREPELYLRAFPPYPKGQTVHIPKVANLTPLPPADV